MDKQRFMMHMQPYTFSKSNYNSIIPLKIFQTWHSKDLPPKMRMRVEELKQQNPEFEHFLFDDDDCREFIKTNFPIHVLNAYDRLIPGAYKADLWRLCVLYINGGIYMDIKLLCINGFKLMELTEANHFVKDRGKPLSIYNACMVCQKNHPCLLMAIKKLVTNIKYNFYGNSPLEPTGPVMLGNLILNNKLRVNIDMTYYWCGNGCVNNGFIIFKNRFVISTEYPEYDSERKTLYNSINTKRYDELWFEKKIYMP